MSSKVLAVTLAVAALIASSSAGPEAAFAQGASNKKLEWHKCLIHIYKVKNQWPQVFEEYAALTRLEPKDAQLRFEYGASLHKMGRVKEAIGQYRAAADMNPFNQDYQGAVGDALVTLKDYSGALKYYQKAGPKYAGKLATTAQYVQQLKAITQYNQEIKRRQQEDE